MTGHFRSALAALVAFTMPAPAQVFESTGERSARSNVARLVTGAPDYLRGVVDMHEAGGGGWFEIVPIDPTVVGLDPYPEGVAVSGDTVALTQTSQRLWFEIRLGGWGSEVQIQTWQITIDKDSFSNGVGGDLQVPTAVPCMSPDDCSPVFGLGSRCATPCFGCAASCAHLGCETNCEHLYQDVERDAPAALLCISSAHQELWRIGTTLCAGFSGPFDDGSAFYGGNFVLDAPPGAAGEYSIRILDDASAFMIVWTGEVPIVEFRSARVVVDVPVPCCDVGGWCSMRSVVACTDAGGTHVAACAGDCDGNGTNDACQPFVDCNVNGEHDACEVATQDCNANGVPDACDIDDGTEPDCNGNGWPDSCDAAIVDCNANGVPDECDINGGTETDCNGNGLPDSCDVDVAGVAVDCNDTGTLDDCDIADGTSLDADGNCIPDECDQSPMPLAEPAGMLKSRFLSFRPVNAGCGVAIRVKLVSLTPPGRGSEFAGFEGEVRWVGPPEMALEDPGSGTMFGAAQIQCDPHFEDWAPLGVLHVFGGSIMPESFYEVQFFDGVCGDVNDPACFSDALPIATSRWADVV